MATVTAIAHTMRRAMLTRRRRGRSTRVVFGRLGPHPVLCQADENANVSPVNVKTLCAGVLVLCLTAHTPVMLDCLTMPRALFFR